MLRHRVSILLLATIAACASSPASRYVQLRDVQHAAQQQTEVLLKADAIRIEDAERLLAIFKIVDARLDEFREAIASGTPKAVLDQILDSARELLSNAQTLQLFFKKSAPVPVPGGN